jgi:hypothetical protein
MPDSNHNPEPMVLTEQEALELFSSLLAAARTQLDDPAVYGSMRLLTAAENLRDIIQGRVSSEARQLFNSTLPLTTKAQINILDEEIYQAILDELNREVAAFMVAQSKQNGETP